ncbi:hypothetical protein J3D55_001363 [Chryseobacterium ginsenosidimutans]|uniref:hypothetical protein n=1 Tax=Chryseobacterium ginsenosidimutans TaxID=687846 RepID=UPI002166D1DF|nr:hypothetical protein [Chryseobacterium ginsenosidimutans]MCS3868447.1 hypothetical protein [Chryseobacterium ginsenosidimutans]
MFGQWSLTGNSGTTPINNFLGTSDDQDVVFKTNNIERMRIFGGPYVNGIVIGNQSAAGNSCRWKIRDYKCTL